MSGLAWQIAKSLQQLALVDSGRVVAATREPRPVVFLAECGHDMRTTRDHLVTDLLMHRYEVLPTEQLQLTESALVPEVKAQLERSALSIHLQDEYTASTVAIAEALKLLAAERLSALSASGRINTLDFLSRTAPLAWDPALEAAGRESIARLRRDAGQQTDAELQRLVRLLDVVKAGEAAPPAANRN